MPSFPSKVFSPDQFQLDLWMMLSCSSQLAGINVQSYRRMRLLPLVDWSTLVTAKNASGKAGCGVLVLEPYARSNVKGIAGGIFEWFFPIACMECPPINDNATVGIGTTAYELAAQVVDVVHIHADDLYGTLEVDTNAIIEDEDEFVLTNCVGKRTTFRITAKSANTNPVSTVIITPGINQVTLTTNTNNAAIYYTLDGSWPASSVKINPSTNLYTEPFSTPPAGTLIRAAAFLPGLNCSETRALQL